MINKTLFSDILVMIEIILRMESWNILSHYKIRKGHFRLTQKKSYFLQLRIKSKCVLLFMKKKVTTKYESRNLGFIRDDTQINETFSPIRFYGAETEIDMEKRNSQGNCIVGSFSVFILY